MRGLLLGLVVLCGCAMEMGDADNDPVTSSTTSAVSLVFYEKLDNIPPGPVGGHAGWRGNCVVFDDSIAPNRYLKCADGASASKPTNGPWSTGNFYLQLDTWPNVNVVDSTHGKLSLEGPQGRVLQVIVGCDNIRVAYQMNGPVATLLTFPCNSTPPPPRYRVICTWSSPGTILRCGAAPHGADPATWAELSVPSFRPFDTVAVMSFPLPGATLFDKIYLESN
jgi:hypothetical protein